MLLLYLQPFREASTLVGISQFRRSVRRHDCSFELPPCLPKPDEQCRPFETTQAIDRTTQRYFLERRLFL